MPLSIRTQKFQQLRPFSIDKAKLGDPAEVLVVQQKGRFKVVLENSAHGNFHLKKD